MEIHSNLLSDVIKFYKEQLSGIYSESELQTICNWIFEKQLGLKSAEILSGKDTRVNQSDLIRLEQMAYKLKRHMPIQYVLGEAEFYGLKFKVNPAVLIPRPETEELVELIIKNSDSNIQRILDIGSGSGCIPIALKNNLPSAEVYALDISEAALEVANYNSLQNRTDVHFFKADILAENAAAEICKQSGNKRFDLLVSNPPYVLASDEVDARVKDFEPHLALFVEDNDPILFYKKIAGVAKDILQPNGKLYFECHFKYAGLVADYLTKQGFTAVSVIKDMSGSDRFVTALAPKGY